MLRNLNRIKTIFVNFYKEEQDFFKIPIFLLLLFIGMIVVSIYLFCICESSDFYLCLSQYSFFEKLFSLFNLNNDFLMLIGAFYIAIFAFLIPQTFQVVAKLADEYDSTLIYQEFKKEKVFEKLKNHLLLSIVVVAFTTLLEATIIKAFVFILLLIWLLCIVSLVLRSVEKYRDYLDENNLIENKFKEIQNSENFENNLKMIVFLTLKRKKNKAFFDNYSTKLYSIPVPKEKEKNYIEEMSKFYKDSYKDSFFPLFYNGEIINKKIIYNNLCFLIDKGLDEFVLKRISEIRNEKNLIFALGKKYFDKQDYERLFAIIDEVVFTDFDLTDKDDYLNLFGGDSGGLLLYRNFFLLSLERHISFSNELFQNAELKEQLLSFLENHRNRELLKELDIDSKRSKSLIDELKEKVKFEKS